MTENAPETPPLPRAKVRSFSDRAERFIPWGSLVLSAASAVLMDRREERGGLIAILAGVSWLALLAFLFLHKSADDQPNRRPMSRFLRFSSAAASQSLAQSSLFFSAPFYVEAFAFTPLQMLFALMFVLAVAVTLWDPWCFRALLHPAIGPSLMGFASFAGANAVLPMLGVRHALSVWFSAAAVGTLMLLAGLATERPGAVGHALRVVAGLAAVLAVGGTRLLPPAPLRLTRATLATGVSNRQPVNAAAHYKQAPETLFCFTAIRAPHELKESLYHVWTHDGRVDRIKVDVRGGRRAGFRTWTRMALPKGARGRYRCTIETTLGQTLGSVEAIVGS